MQDVSAMQEELQQYGDQIQKINEEKAELAEKEDRLKQEHEEANKRHTESTERDSHITNRLQMLAVLVLSCGVWSELNFIMMVRISTTSATMKKY